MIDFMSYADEFKEMFTDTWLTPRGVTFSEGFAITSLMKHYDVDIMIESGVAYGGSLEMIAKCRPENIVIGIDTFKAYSDSLEYAKKRLHNYGNVRIVVGDSLKVLPAILNEASKDLNFGIFIDGPKGDLAVDFGHYLYDNDPRIKFMCIHDIWHDTPQATLCRKVFDNVIFTDEPDGVFAEARNEIDSHMLKINKELCSPSKSSLNPEEGLGYFQTTMEEYPYGFGMAMIERP